jgi:transcription initiation factor TFIIIB Brf1 subunit/transcription initiation factor TFIIB
MAVHLHLKKEVASQVGIANAAGLTEVTLRNRLKDLTLRHDVTLFPEVKQNAATASTK